MVRRTVTIPEYLDSRVRDAARQDESFSAAVTRLLEAGLRSEESGPDWIGSWESDDPDLAFKVEEVLDELARTADPND